MIRIKFIGGSAIQRSSGFSHGTLEKLIAHTWSIETTFWSAQRWNISDPPSQLRQPSYNRPTMNSVKGHTSDCEPHCSLLSLNNPFMISFHSSEVKQHCCRIRIYPAQTEPWLSSKVTYGNLCLRSQPYILQLLLVVNVMQLGSIS